MRIAHVTSGLDRYAAGVGAVVAALSKEQEVQGVEVQVFGLESTRWLTGDKDNWEGASVQALKVRGLPRSFGYAPTLARELANYNPDVVHLHGLWMYPGLAVYQWHRKTGNPYVYSTHGMLSPVALGFSVNKKRAISYLFQDAALASAAILHATTEAEGNDFRRFGLVNPIEVVPLGIQERHVPMVQPEPLQRILSLGRFHPQKGLERLIEAWSHLERRHPQWALDLVGPDEGAHMAELQRLTSKLNLQRKISSSLDTFVHINAQAARSKL